MERRRRSRRPSARAPPRSPLKRRPSAPTSARRTTVTACCFSRPEPTHRGTGASPRSRSRAPAPSRWASGPTSASARSRRTTTPPTSCARAKCERKNNCKAKNNDAVIDARIFHAVLGHRLRRRGRPYLPLRHVIGRCASVTMRPPAHAFSPRDRPRLRGPARRSFSRQGLTAAGTLVAPAELPSAASWSRGSRTGRWPVVGAGAAWSARRVRRRQPRARRERAWTPAPSGCGVAPPSRGLATPAPRTISAAARRTTRSSSSGGVRSWSLVNGECSSNERSLTPAPQARVTCAPIAQ